jgi:predicted phosphodiesterase
LRPARARWVRDCSIAVLPDIHGVLPALGAVPAEPDVAAAGLFVLTGDVASGPQPAAVLGRPLGLGERVTRVRGNADSELVALARGADIEIPDEISPRQRAVAAERAGYFGSSQASDADALAAFGPRDGRPVRDADC